MSRTPLLLLVALAGALTPTRSPAQMQPLARYEGTLYPVVECTPSSAFVLVKGRKRGAESGIEFRPASEFGPGMARIENVVADLDPLRDAPVKERTHPSSIRFRYEAEVISDEEVKSCFGVLTLVANGSIITHAVPINGLKPGKPRRIKVELVNRVDSVGRLHLFFGTKEVRSNQVTEPYEAKGYLEALRAGAGGVSATELCQTVDRFPHVLSDDGRLLATVRRRDTHRSLIVYDIEAMNLVLDLKLGEKGESAWDLTWISDHELVYLTWDEQLRWTRSLMLLDTRTGKPEKLKRDVDRILTAVPNQPGTIVIQRDSGAWYSAMWKFDVRRRKMSGEDRIQPGWTYFDDNGEERVRYEPDGARRKLFYKKTARDKWRHLDSVVADKQLRFDVDASKYLDRVCDIHSFGPDGDTLYISTRVDSDRFELKAFSLSQAKIVQTVARHSKYDVNIGNDGASILLFRKGTSELIGLAYDAERLRVTWLDEYYAAVQSMMDKAFPENVNHPLDWSKDGGTFIYFSFSDRDPGTYYVLRPRESKLVPLLVAGEALKSKELGRTLPITFTARDGQAVHGYVTYPPGEFTRPAPLVVNVHGGPAVRDSWHFDATNQFLATRGYVVLQVNYRGSSGFGAAYQKAGLYARLDTVVLDDIADGAKHLISEGVADPKRVAVMGGSFGGWATYMSLIKYPELYRAGIAIAAVSHWRKTIKDDRSRFDNKFAAVYWKELLDREDFDEIEPFIDPFLRAAELKQPIYIMHGEWDNIVHPTEAKLMLEKLRKSNPHVESMSFVNASHSYWPYESRVRMLNEIESFLRRHMPPAETSATE